MTRKSIFILFFLCVFVFNSSKRHTRLDWDVFGYYLYLPAQFIYDDIHLEKKEVWLNPIIEKYHTTEGFYQAYKGPKDKLVMKYTMGLSFVYAPFFFVADFMAMLFHFDRDGFSPPYQWMMMLCALFFSLLGIYYLFKILSLYFSETIVFATIALLVFGSNYFVMTAYDGLMPHNFIFTFFAIMLYNTIKWYEVQKLKYAITIGFCIGISVLIRPTSAVVVIIPLLWKVWSLDSMRARIKLFIHKFYHLFVIGGVAFLVILPQLIYWKSVSGQWLFYSYPGEKIQLSKPHLLNVLFSYKKGWLLYTPLMCFAIWGFVSLFKKHRELFLPVFIFFIVNTYLVSCWDCWWYGGSFAQRPFVESYVFMAFPLAAFIHYLSLKKQLVVITALVLSLVIIHLNLFQTHQAENGILHTTLTTKEYYWRVFLKGEATEEDKRWLEPAQYADGKDALNLSLKYDKVYSSNLSLNESSALLNAGTAFSKSITVTANLGYDVQDNYLITSVMADTNTANTSSDITAHLVTVINKDGKLYKYRSRDFNYSDIKNTKAPIDLSVLIPPQANNKNYEILSYVYIDGDKKMKLLNLTATVLKAVK